MTSRRERLSYFRLESFQQPFGKARSIEDRAQQKKTSAGIFLTGCFQKNFTHFGIAGESLRSLKQPYIQLAFCGSQIGSEFGVIVRRVVHQKSGMHFEKLREQPSSRLRH